MYVDVLIFFLTGVQRGANAVSNRETRKWIKTLSCQRMLKLWKSTEEIEELCAYKGIMKLTFAKEGMYVKSTTWYCYSSCEL